MIEATVMCQRFYAWRRVRVSAAAGCIRHETRGLPLRLLDQLKLLAWCNEQVCEPLEVFRSDPGWRQAERQSRQFRLERLVDVMSAVAARHLTGLLQRRRSERGERCDTDAMRLDAF